MVIATINPATGDEVRNFDNFTDEHIDETLQRAVETFLR
jgi:hypothetical protein